MNVKKNNKNKGFIQIPLLIGIIVSVVVISGVTTGVVLHKQGRLVPLVANISGVFRSAEEITIIEKVELEEPQTERPEISQEEISQQEQELEQARLETEKARTEAEQLEIKNEEVKKLAEKEEQVLTPSPKSMSEDFQITSVNLIPQKDFLRMEWKTSEPSESEILIWPPEEVSGKSIFKSPSRSSMHYANIHYNLFPLYSIGSGERNDYIEYNYKIIATSADGIFTSKSDSFALSENINISFITRLIILNPNLACRDFDPFGGIEKLFCKNYRKYNDLIDGYTPQVSVNVNVIDTTQYKWSISIDMVVKKLEDGEIFKNKAIKIKIPELNIEKILYSDDKGLINYSSSSNISVSEIGVTIYDGDNDNIIFDKSIDNPFYKPPPPWPPPPPCNIGIGGCA